MRDGDDEATDDAIREVIEDQTWEAVIKERLGDDVVIWDEMNEAEWPPPGTCWRVPLGLPARARRTPATSPVEGDLGRRRGSWRCRRR